MNIELPHLYISSGHNYVGHHGQTAGEHAMVEVGELRCVAGRGIDGDRFFNHKENFKGQITFFACEVYEQLCRRFDIWDKSPSVFRRNAITRGVELETLIGREFQIQGVSFVGVESCKPCYWMDQAFAPGSEAALHERGGLRARILTSGVIARDGVFDEFDQHCSNASPGRSHLPY